MDAHTEAPQASKWATRWVYATLIQAGIAIVLTAYLLWEAVFGTPAASRIVAGGGAGTWLNMGFIGYLLLGIGGAPLTSWMYQYIEVRLRKDVRGLATVGAWGHILLWNVGVVGGTLLMMHAGFRGGRAAIAPNFGGLGFNAAQVHEIMSAYPMWIAGFLAIGLVGAVFGLGALALTVVRPMRRAVPAKATA
jgi:hypothetical protein